MRLQAGPSREQLTALLQADGYTVDAPPTPT